jgi:hypothetical protein
MNWLASAGKGVAKTYMHRDIRLDFFILAFVPDILLNILRKAILFDVWDKNGKSALTAPF